MTSFDVLAHHLVPRFIQSIATRLAAVQIVAYLYSDPLIDEFPDPQMWGLEVDRVYQDLGDRVALRELLQTCQSNAPDYLLLRRLDELGDQVEDISHCLSCFEQYNVELITLDSRGRSPHTQQPDFLQLIHDLRSRQIRRSHARNRLNAAPRPGRVPYGYKRGRDRYLLNRSTAPIVKSFFEHFLLYGSLRGAVRHLEKKFGKKISITTGKRWLTNPVYRGDLIYSNGDKVPDTHIAILTREEAAQIDRLLRRNRGLAPRSASASRSLAGLVQCQECQAKTTINSTRQRGQAATSYVYLRPIHCPRHPQCSSLRYEKILDRTIEQICQRLPPAVAVMESPQLNQIKVQIVAEIAEKKQILEQINQLEHQQILDAETAQLRRYKLRVEIAHLQDNLATLPPENLRSIAASVSLKQFWLDLSEPERRFYFREFIRAIEIVHWPTSDWSVQLRFIFEQPHQPE